MNKINTHLLSFLGGIFMCAAESVCSDTSSLFKQVQVYCADKKAFKATENIEQKIIDGIYPAQDILNMIDNYQANDQHCSPEVLVQHVTLYNAILDYVLQLENNPKHTFESLAAEYAPTCEKNLASKLFISIAFLMKRCHWSSEHVASLLDKDYVSFLRFADRGMAQAIEKKADGTIGRVHNSLPFYDLYDLTMNRMWPFSVPAVKGIKNGFKSLAKK
ncbi:hypothetical protein KBD08_04460 [Candidatus Babeliales bacterium]|nr:hypothetical protein [Candidatus Babeliales bacterium]